jgi:hypothetical protein
MSLPTNEELAQIAIKAAQDAYRDEDSVVLSWEEITKLNPCAQAAHTDAAAAVRDAVLDGLIAEAQSRVLLFATWGGSESKDPPPAMALADWLREMKGTP